MPRRGRVSGCPIEPLQFPHRQVLDNVRHGFAPSPEPSAYSSSQAPITRISYHAYPEERKCWNERASVGRAALKHWEKQVTAALEKGRPVPPKPELATIPPEPVRPRVSVSDITVEKLAEIIGGLPKGVLYRRDELAGWLLNMGRYSAGTDRPFWLEAYVGGPHQVDRKSRPDPVLIPHLSVPVFGTIQPDRLADVLSGADDGLAARFLWAWPEPRGFARPTGSADTEGAARALGRLAALGMAEDAEGCPCPAYVPLAAEAVPALEAFSRETQAQEAVAHGLMKSALGKARGQALRLALVLEHLWWCAGTGADPKGISAPAMQAACGLMDGYFLPMARRVLGDASIPQEERNARTLATWITQTRPALVNVSLIRDDTRLPGLRETEPVKAACRYLSDARWLVAPDQTGKPGRPRGDYRVNPQLWEVLG